MKNKLIILIGAFCLLLSADALAQNTSAAKPVAVEPETEKNSPLDAVGFKRIKTAEIKTAEVSAASMNGTDLIKKDQPKTDTYRLSTARPLTAQQPNPEPEKMAAKPKVLIAQQ